MTQPPAPSRIQIFDTSLRDGEQAPGFSMTVGQKRELALALDALGVDVIEAGFPAASACDFTGVEAIAGLLSRATACALARCLPDDIAAAGRALKPARRARIHVFIATSPIHREHKLGMSRAQVLAAARAGVIKACQLADEVEFSAEDAIRTEPDFLEEVLAAAHDAGATTLNIPDTVGYTTPSEIRALFARLAPRFPDAVLSAHCHDDLGLAVANSLAAVDGGARQVECTLAGIGERAGNAALEEVVMALSTRADRFACQTGVDRTRLYPTAQLMARLTGQALPRNKAIVGRNAFAHESGIHQHGMLKSAQTYEIIDPQSVGVPRSDLVLGRHSGRHALAERCAALGHPLDRAGLDALFPRFKALCQQQREVLDDDLEDLIDGGAPAEDGPWRLDSLQVTSSHGTGAPPFAAVSLSDTRTGRTVREAASAAKGPIAAAFAAIDRATDQAAELEAFAIEALTEGIDARGEARVTVRVGRFRARGRASDADIVVAAARAYLIALNRSIRRQAKAAAKREEVEA